MERSAGLRGAVMSAAAASARRERRHYHTYAEMEALMRGWAEAHPEVCALESIGASPEGRELWLLTLTVKATGAHDTKPAFWQEANTHAGEVTGTEAALQLADRLLTRYADGEPGTVELLRTSTVYILPRIAVDGAEKYLTTEHTLRSSPLSASAHPPEWPGLRALDVDGNDKLLVMRIKDRFGTFKKSDEDSRIMVPRGPDEYGGEYYRLLPEGEFVQYETHGGPGGSAQKGRPDQYDLNRAFPTGFQPGQQSGGPYPLYLVESQHVVKALRERNNVCAMLTHHTSGRLLIMPAGGAMNASDRRLYENLNKFGEDLTGYKIVGRRQTAPGATTVAWAYYHRGVVVWLPEIWNLHDHIGLPGALDGTADDELIDGLARDRSDDPSKFHDQHATQFERPYHNLVALLHWAEEHLPEGSFFEDWTTFLHPQLGEVEVGGFLFKYLLQNPPHQLLEDECTKMSDFGTLLAGSLPRVRVVSATAEPLGKPGAEPVSRVVVHLANEGYLSTRGTEQAAEIGAVRGEALATLELGEGQELLSASPRPAVGPFPHLEGRASGHSGMSTLHPSRYENWTESFNPHEARLEWLVAGAGCVTVKLDFERGGVIEATVELAPAPAAAL